MATRQLVIVLLCTASLAGMDNYFDTARTCNLEGIRAIIPPEALKNHPLEFFNIALTCDNTHTVLEEFNKTIIKDQPVRNSTFAHLVNRAHKNYKKNYFLEKLIECGKYK